MYRSLIFADQHIMIFRRQVPGLFSNYCAVAFILLAGLRCDDLVK
jgi:hypothetical protein|tara:strand:- start:2680 stop:2814 length:135 start_codon:yes stop_codon:yes gene_type:complete